MAQEKALVCSHRHHIKILYFTCAILCVFSISCFVVTFLFLAQLRDDLSQKCSCPDGEMLFAITVFPPSSEDEGPSSSPRPSRAARRRNGATSNGEVRAELGLTARNGDRNGRDELPGFNRVRKDTPGGKDFNFQGTSIEAYARLPITISLDSVIAFCNNTASKCPAGPPGPKGADGKPGPPGTARNDGDKNCTCVDKDLESQIEMLLASTAKLAGQIGPPGLPGPQGQTGDPGPQGVSGEPGQDGEPGAQGESGYPGPEGPPAEKGEKGDIGPEGQQGEPGPIAQKGAIGYMGPQGIQGPIGLKGLKGDLGEAGPQGQHGRHGKAGAKGEQGQKGEGGSRGPSRTRGDMGDAGTFDEIGSGQQNENRNRCLCAQPASELLKEILQLDNKTLQLLHGPPGPRGIRGPEGKPGVDGGSGSPGEKGDPGEPGSGGSPGPVGPSGPKGTPGAKGLAGSFGYPGEKGSKGPVGMTGQPGNPGSSGPSGIDGLPGEHGEIGQVGPPGEPGERGQVGQPGERGKRGEKGESGVDGLPGPVGPPSLSGTNENGSPAGAPGAPGLPGINGLPGGKGEKGDNGQDGEQGVNGKKGDRGGDGVQGIKGEKGDRGGDGLTGEQGPQGEPGVDGNQGPAGEKGDKGDIGKIGPVGPSGRDGSGGRPGSKGEKGHQGIASGMIQLGNDGELEKQVKVTDPTPVDTPKTPPPLRKTPMSECSLMSIGDPVDHHYGNTFWGSWMQDTAPDPPNPDKIWVTKHIVGDVVYEYSNMVAMKSNRYSKYYRLSYFWAGTGHVVYNNALYFHTGGSAEIVCFDFTTEAITARNTIPGAIYQPQNGIGYLYDSDYTYLDLAVDDNGLWVIYKTVEHNQNLVLSRLNLENLSVFETIVSEHPQSSAGDAFVMCGVLYTTKSSKNRYSTVDFAVNLFTGEVLPDTDIPYENSQSKSTMMSFNPRKQLIYAWDKGKMITYSISVN